VIKFAFFPLETKKTTFFAKIFKIQEGRPPFPPSDAHGLKWDSCACWAQGKCLLRPHVKMAPSVCSYLLKIN